MQEIWSYPDLGLDPPLQQGGFDPRKIETVIVYPASSSESRDFVSRRTIPLPTDEKGYVPWTFATPQANENGRSLGRNWGFNQTLKGIMPYPRGATVIIWGIEGELRPIMSPDPISSVNDPFDIKPFQCEPL
jgi:hypothetical protein